MRYKIMLEYIGLIRKEPGSDFGVEFPDFPGCVTAGNSLDEAKAMAKEALQGHIECIIAEGISIPNPSSLKTIMSDSANIDATAILISISG